MKILLTNSIYDTEAILLKSGAEVVQLSNATPAQIMDAAGDVEGIVTRLEEISREVINAAPRLKVIGRFGVGYDNIDVQAASERKIPVVYTPGANSLAVAEHTMGLILSLAKQTVFWDKALKEKNWERRNEGQNVNLEGKTLGIIGLGNIGKRVSIMARVFGMKVIAYDPFVDADSAREVEAEMIPLDDVLKTSDFITIHAPLDEGTRELIGKDKIGLLKKGVMLVNTARGPIVDLDAVYEALNDGTLRRVALDVFPHEPPDFNHPIFTHPNFFGAPHVASLSTETLEHMSQVVAQGVIDVLNGSKPKFIVNPEVLR